MKLYGLSRRCGALLMAMCLFSGTLAAQESLFRPGLVAHYFKDPENWEGRWNDDESEPRDLAANWTFRSYAYSRVEPLVNHRFTNRGWFSVRWVGWLDTRAVAVHTQGLSVVTGRVNVSPSKADHHEFSLTTDQGEVLTGDRLRPRSAASTGIAHRVFFRTHGQGRENTVMVDGVPFELRPQETLEIQADAIAYRLEPGPRAPASGPAGQWWLTFSASNARVVCTSAPAAKPLVSAGKAATRDYIFEVYADDGCRLYLDGNLVIDDWRACWEGSPGAVRRSPPVALEQGFYHIVVEYFQGQSLAGEDHDPVVLYWSSPDQGLSRQIIPPGQFFYMPDDLIPPSSGR